MSNNRARLVWRRPEGQCSCGAECGDRKVARNATGGVGESQIEKCLVCHTKESSGEGGNAGGC